MRPRKRKRSIGLRGSQPLGIDVPVLPAPGDPVVALFSGADIDSVSRGAYVVWDGSTLVPHKCDDPSYDDSSTESAAFDGHKWVLVGEGGAPVLTSPDDVSLDLTNRGNPWGTSDAGMTDIIFCPGINKWVVCQNGGTANLIATATDPTLSWTQHATPWDSLDGGRIQGLGYSQDLNQILACGNDFDFLNVLMKSDDGGVTWEGVDTGSAVGNELYRAAWSPTLGLWAVVGPAGDGNGIYTYDGDSTFTPVLSGGVYTDVAWSPEMEKFLAIANGAARYSDDGVTWTLASNTDHANITGVCWSPFMHAFFVHVGGSARMLFNIDDWFDSANMSVTLGTPHGISEGRCIAK